MSTVGYSTTPTGGSFSEGVNVGDQVGGLAAMPTPGGLITTLHAYAATFTGTVTPTLCLWDGSGNLLASVAATASVGTSPAWLSGTLATPVFVASGAQIYIGWANPAANGFTAKWDAVGTPTIHWNEQASPPAALTGFTTDLHQLGAYADYTPLVARVRRTGAWSTATAIDVRRASAWALAQLDDVRRSGVWQPGT